MSENEPIVFDGTEKMANELGLQPMTMGDKTIWVQQLPGVTFKIINKGTKFVKTEEPHKMRVWWNTQGAGAEGSEVIEIPFGASSEEIEVLAKEKAMQHIKWWYGVIS